MGLKQKMMDAFGYPGQVPCLTFVEEFGVANVGTQVIVEETEGFVTLVAAGENAIIHDTGAVMSWLKCKGYEPRLHQQVAHDHVWRSVIAVTTPD